MALLTGGASGMFTALILGFIGSLSIRLWGDLAEQGLNYNITLPWSLGVCGGMGFILMLLHRDDPRNLLPELGETLTDLRQPDRAPQRHEFRSILGASLAQIGGGCVGPEALLTRLTTVASERIWAGRDKDLQQAAAAGSLAIFGAPLLGGAVVNQHRFNLETRWIPGVLGGLAGFALFHGIEEITGGALKHLPYLWPTSLRDDAGTLGAGLIAGIAGSGLGWLLRSWREWLTQRQLLQNCRWWPVFTGLLLGGLMHWLPLVPFAGEHQIRPLLEGANQSSAGILILSGLTKLLMLGLCLETGWRGGIFFPGFVICCAFGSGFYQLLPAIGTHASWCGGLTSGFFVLMLQKPLVVLVLSLSLLQGHGSTGVLVGVLIGHLVNQWLGSGDAPQPLPETPDSP